VYDFWPDGDGIRRKIKMPKDPSTIFVELPLGPNEDDSPRWSFTITELVENSIWTVEQGEGGPIGVEDAEGLAAIRDRLRQLADTLDAALARPDPDAPRRYA